MDSYENCLTKNVKILKREPTGIWVKGVMEEKKKNA